MTDLLSIKSKMFRGLIKKIIARKVRESIGIDLDLNIESLEFEHSDESGKMRFNLSCSGEISDDDLSSLVAKILK